MLYHVLLQLKICKTKLGRAHSNLRKIQRETFTKDKNNDKIENVAVLLK